MAVNEDDRKGALGAARALLGKVVDKVVDAAFGGGAVAPPPKTEGSPAPSEEPIPTRTMAGLLVAQGHRERALAIYDHLIEAHPDDPRLRSEADALRGGDGAAGRAEGGALGGDDIAPVVAVAAGQDRLLLSWQVPEDALDRARRVLGEDGELRARVMVTAADSDGVVVTKAVERRDIARAGEWVLPAPPGALCNASVGVARGERFVSAAHAPTVAV